MNLRSSTFAAVFGLTLCTGTQASPGHEGHIQATKNKDVAPTFDIVHAKITRDGANLVFQQQTAGEFGTIKPQKTGKLPGSDVFSYVWPTSLDSSIVGFEPKQGILALVLTTHPDFDDTPKYDENRDGTNNNDGNVWHSHWVVLTDDTRCGPTALKVKDIPEGATPKLPSTWPGLPLLLDSPGYEPNLSGKEVTVNVPMKDLGFPDTFKFDGVSAGLQVNANAHNPLLCVTKVHDIASGDLSLPGFLLPEQVASK
ncbi:hypothetical protein OLMES_3007 [Oleiphilus messinensis]|uniref:Gll3595 protein n=1 Tax=Oleiphilus messinensis TaxID=141451 RepID=A0A1Y0I9B1_9GAMM|nr:hypothetical protein [Oleiphilus messinensis]ARU57051.1 hypothetical protein OLMES_3007 [Oleiphilus messinensis]